MERLRRIIALPGYYVRALGVALFLMGAVTPAWWAYLRTRAYIGVKANVTFAWDGPVRPAMIVLPAMPSGKRFAISERPVTYGEFVRVVGDIPVNGHCDRPLAVDPSESQVICISPREAAHYSEWLTDKENQARRISGRKVLKPCYKSADVNDVDMSCTGYRLPTIEEWRYAVTLGSVASEASALAGPTNKGCRSASWFIFGMCDALEIAVRLDGGPVGMKADGGGADFPYSATRPTAFRIVQTALEKDPFY